jgi:4-hydroxythreonine-4-phosphate dehydrogenase
MFMVSDTLKVGVVTGHIPIAKVAESITAEKILTKLRLMDQSLRQDFWVRKPRIAVLGLNPHAGDNGLIGNEEKDIIVPALEEARSNDILAMGPYPADGFFANGAYLQFDAVLAMYHDQGLIPFKQIAFEQGVNFTAGLSFVRTSPDHGTAYDIAGKNKASETSFREALFTAIHIMRRRRENEVLNENPLQFTKLSRDRD